MARGRMVNKKISNSKRVNDLPLPAQLLYTWLIPHLDCNGVFFGSSGMVKNLVLPRKNYSAKQIESWLKLFELSTEVEPCPLIVRYTSKGEVFLWMPGFEGEQTNLRKDKEKPEYPPPSEEIRKKYGILTESIRKNDGAIEVKGSEENRIEVKGSEEELDGNAPKKKYGEFKNVLLSAQEYEKLVSRLGDVKTNDLIERLSAYMKSRKKRYENHYATLLNWSRDDALKEIGAPKRGVLPTEEQLRRENMR